MGYTLITSVAVPVYASWKCRKCGCVNLSKGYFHAKKSQSTDSYREVEVIREDFKWYEDECHGDFYLLIDNVYANAAGVRDALYLNDTRCRSCARRPLWARRLEWISEPLLHFLAVLFGLLFWGVLNDTASMTRPSGFLISVLFTLLAALELLLLAEKWLRKYAIERSFPEYPLVIGSVNADLTTQAERRGKAIPNPYEAVNIASGAVRREELTQGRWNSLLPDPSIDAQGLSAQLSFLMTDYTEANVQFEETYDEPTYD